MPNLDSRYSRIEIVYALRRTNKLLASRILWKDSTELLRPSVFLEILIHLNELLQIDKSHNKRLKFKEDITGSQNNDITDLINDFRNAACHSESKRRWYDEYLLAFIEIRGKGNHKIHPA